MELNENEITFIEEIATQLTELYYGDDTWAEEVEQHFIPKYNIITRVFSEEAQEMYDGKYDEWKTYYTDIIKERILTKTK